MAESEFAETIASLMDGISPIREAVIGYRKQCEDAGFSPTMAEGMAGELHSGLMRMLFRQTGGNK
jgi:hypothetical protein